MSKKLILEADEALWKQVKAYRKKLELRNNNVAVLRLLRKALKK